MSLQAAQFRRILEDARNRVASSGIDTTVVAAHLAQMRLFMLKQGIEIFATQDSYGMRREFLRRVMEFNQLHGKLDSIVDNFLVGGRGLWFARPVKDLYRIHYFTEKEYRAYYNEDEELEELQIIYSFRVRSQYGPNSYGIPGLTGDAGNWNNGNDQTRWMKMTVYRDRIVQVISNQQPQFDGDIRDSLYGNTRTYVNSFGFIPAVECFNNRGLSSGEGRGDFDWLASHIIEHDRMVRAIRRNITFFGGPTLVSSRPRHDLLEPTGENGADQRPTMASNSGFISLNRGSTRTSDPAFTPGDTSFRVPRIIANVEATDRVAFLTPDPVPGDLSAYTAEYQEMIRTALGGVDDLSIRSGATAYEVRTLYGRVNATAKRKCRDLFDYGLCRLMSMLIVNEERLFKDSFAQAVGIRKPVPVLYEDLPPEERQRVSPDDLRQQYQRDMSVFEDRYRKAMDAAKEQGELPNGLVGLIPDGDPRVEYRWMGEVFPDGPQEKLQNSMVCRNLQELGVGSIEALRELFPEKTPEERSAMLNGLPFRVAEATQRTAGIFLDLLRGMYQVPHPQMPDRPLAADPQLDLVPFLYKTLSFLQRELSYSGTYSNADPAQLPATLSDADRIRAERGQPTELERERERRRAAFAAAGIGSTLNGLAGGVPGPDQQRQPDSAAVFPGPDGALDFDPANPYAGAGGKLGTGAGIPGALGSGPMAGTASGLELATGPGGTRLGPSDLLLPTNPVAGAEQLLAGPGAGAGAAAAGGSPGAAAGRRSPAARRAERRRPATRR